MLYRQAFRIGHRPLIVAVFCVESFEYGDVQIGSDGTLPMCDGSSGPQHLPKCHKNSTRDNSAFISSRLDVRILGLVC